MRLLYLLAASLVLGSGLRADVRETPFGAVPSSRQLAWHQLEAYAFVHFTVNTFTDKEWGYGDESPDLFNPSSFDAEQIAGAAKAAGLRGLILTAKHHDGFCLWPSKLTQHSIARSPYKQGQGDIVREMSDACKKLGLKFGIYLSPWDRNRADYGTPAYLEYYRGQLRELLTNYGPVFEIWFDGANGGDGYYGGARETRKIDNKTYYDWPTTWKLARELQPGAVLFSDGGPDARWVGNEVGAAGLPCWHTIDAAGFVPGHSERLANGDRFGPQWLPAEVDVSLRPGWFYHESEDAKVKSPEELFRIYLHSVGRGANLILNITPDKRGLIPEQDVDSLRGWKRLLDDSFSHDLLAGASLSRAATGVPAVSPARVPAELSDRNPLTYQLLDYKDGASSLVLELPEDRLFDLLDLSEYLPLGQRIGSLCLDRWDDSVQAWLEIAHASSIGSRRILALERPVSARRLRLRVEAPAAPALSELHLYLSKLAAEQAATESKARHE